jgi:hypothetical protein
MRSSLRAPRAGTLLVWAPVLCAALYAGAVLANLHTLLAAVYVDSDAALAPVLGQAIGHIPAGSFVSLGNHAWYEEWLFLTATRSLPSHLLLWELAPLAWSLAGLALLLAGARRALGASAALLCAAALVCVGPFGRFCFLAINWHSLTAVHTALLATALVWLAPRIESLAFGRLLAAAAALGLVDAVALASDSLFLVWAILPAAVAAVLLERGLGAAARRRLLAFLLVSLAVALVGALLLAGVMRHAGITARALPITTVGPAELPHNLEVLVESFTFIAGGKLSIAGGFPGIGQLASAVLALAALAFALLEGVSALRPARAQAVAPRQLAFGAFWACSLLASIVVFVFTNAPKDALSGRYLLAAYIATAALLGLAVSRRPAARRPVAVAVCVFAALATYQLIRRPFVAMSRPDVRVHLPGPGTATALARFAAREHVGFGYGNYWDAEDLTWGTGFRVWIRPVRPCRAGGDALCYPQLGDVSSWYRPRPHMRSLLLVDRPGVSYDVITAADPALGRPLAEQRVGYLDAYVYPYDIASRLKRPPCDFSWAHPC